MKNQTKRVDDALAGARKRRPRIDKQKNPSPEERARSEASKLLKVDWSVWEIINQAKLEAARAEYAKQGNPLDQPFRNDRERMLYNKIKYAGKSIIAAFADSYGINVQVDNPEIDNVPAELRVGDMVDLRILNISKKGGVVFDSGNHKENFITRNNLAKFDKFSKVLPVEPIKATIVEVGKKATVVDLYTPMINSFILPRAQKPWIQNLIENPIPVKVKNLHLVKGGYLGQAIIPNISEFVGEPFTVDAFVPGSQIVLNTTDNFEEFEGQTVDTFIMSYSPKPNGQGMSLVCSRKNYLRHEGNLNLIQIHKRWCDDSEEWNDFANQSWPGRITGVLNSAKKCGVFVEIPYLNITGMIPTPADQLVEYPAGKWIDVKFKTFEEEMVYNDNVDQVQRLMPFEIENGSIKRINIKPIFELA